MNILFFIFTFFVATSFAVEITFVGPCDENFILKSKVEENFSHVGELTIKTLQQFNIPFKGSEEGLQSAFQTPTGLEAMEVLSDTELRAYGWCFSVDGVVPENFPHEVPLTSSTKSVQWFFAYSRYSNGEWTEQCTPSHLIKPKFLCP